MKKVIFYARVSDSSYISNTIENQIMLMKQYYKKKIDDIDIVIDDGYSGTDMARPGMQCILEKIDKKMIDIVVAKDISRISRNYIELGMFIRKCLMNRIRLITIEEGEYTCEKDYFMKDMKGLLADMYSKDISMKVKSSLDVRKANGIYAIALVPFGYKKEEGKICIVKEEAKIVQCIFDEFENKKSISSVKHYLDEKGVFTPKEYNNIRKNIDNEEKKLWSYATINKILLNEFYIGTMVYNKTLRKNWASRYREKSGLEKKVYNHHLAIIAREQYYRVKNIHQYNIIRNNRK